MLRSFRVENHKSFPNEAELLLLPAYDKSRPVVPVAGIFGANASGKSNFLDALSWLQAAVRESYAQWAPGQGVPRATFRLDKQSAARPSGYAVDLVIGDTRHEYGVEVNDERVVSEWLYSYPRGRRRVIFERNGQDIKLGSTVADSRARAKVLSENTRANSLFITVAALNNVTEVAPVHDWFQSDLLFTSDGTSRLDDRLARQLTEPGRRKVVSLVRAADLGITDVTVQQHVTLTADLAQRLADAGFLDVVPGRRLLAGQTIDPSEDAQIRSLLPRLVRDGNISAESELRFHHGSSGAVLSGDEQSAGTRSWINLVLNALQVLERGGLLVVDELDASLHSHLAAQLVRLFRDDEANRTGAQLLFTSQDATLMDDDVLLRDEIWFVEKDPSTGVSTIYPLTDFQPRKNENVVGRYLAGGYGAVPIHRGGAFVDAVHEQEDHHSAAA